MDRTDGLHRAYASGRRIVRFADRLGAMLTMTGTCCVLTPLALLFGGDELRPYAALGVVLGLFWAVWAGLTLLERKLTLARPMGVVHQLRPVPATVRADEPRLRSVRSA